jgi:hypothetical protein
LSEEGSRKTEGDIAMENPTMIERMLAEAKQTNDRKKRGRIYNALPGVDNDWFVRLLRDLNQNRISGEDGLLPPTLISSMVAHQASAKLLALFFDAVLYQAESTD